MDSKRFAEGRERSVVSGFELGWGNVAEVGVETFGGVQLTVTVYAGALALVVFCRSRS